ncbi:putative disease resistance protein RGA3 isoform X2 [Salvia divinorum]|uniref:Disease resistance protein RGA3 isoform X2 n=1 Tax=Salvia divinorum TaxID=28513 RepID=A0ABD1GXL9_SALDI
MAEAFLKVILDKLRWLIMEGLGVILCIDEEMRKLCSTLTSLQAALKDADIENSSFRDRVQNLRVPAYKIDDILDECSTHASELKHTGSKLSRYSPQNMLYRHKIGGG